MSEVLVPVGRHFFTPDYITKMAATIKPEDIGEHGAVKFGVDNEGAKVAVIFTPKHGNVAIRTAYAYDWTKGHQFGVDGTVKF